MSVAESTTSAQVTIELEVKTIFKWIEKKRKGFYVLIMAFRRVISNDSRDGDLQLPFIKPRSKASQPTFRLIYATREVEPTTNELTI